MNKIGLIIIAIVLVAGGAFLLSRRSGTASAVESAARYLPEGTLAMIELPDLPRSRTRLEQTALWKLFHEPEVTAFLELPLSQIPSNPKVDESLQRLHTIAPRHFFVAMTALEGSQPKVVGGFAYNGPQAEVDLLLNQAREQIRKAVPGTKADLTRHHDDTIESYTHEETTVAGAFADQWYFIANDVELLKATLDRFRERFNDNSLADAETYRKSVEPLSEDPDVRYYVAAGFFMEKLAALSAMSGQPLTPQQMEQVRAMKGIAGTHRMDGPLFRDRLYTYAPDAPKLPKLDGSTLALTGPDTLLYYAVVSQQPEGFELPPAPPEMVGSNELVSAYHAIRTHLQEAGLTGKDLNAAFGKEIGVLLDWPGGSASEIFGGAVGVADAALARKVVEAGLASWTREALVNGEPIWSLDSGPVLRLAASLSPKYLLFGFNARSVEALAARGSADPVQPLDQSPAFRNALATTGKTADAVNLLAYFDAKTAFERVYDKLRPLAALGLAFVPDASRFVDISKLPPTEVIARNLVPTIAVGAPEGEGYLFESTGTVTFFQGTGLLGVTAGAIAAPFLQGNLPLPGLGNTAPRPAPQNPWLAPPDATPEPSPAPSPAAPSP